MTILKMIFLMVLLMLMVHFGINYPGQESRKRRSLLPLEEEGAAGTIRKKSSLYGSWRFSNERISVERQGKFESELLSDESLLEKQQLLISFFPDSTFTQVELNGNYTSGRWVYDESNASVFFTIGRKTEEVYVAIDQAENGTQALTFHFTAEMNMPLEQAGKGMNRFKQDPYYFANNTWRLKPEKEESDRQLKARLLNYIAHNAYVLKANQIRKQRYISWKFSDGIFRIYKSGIGLVAPEKIPVTWIKSFHSKDAALKAYQFIDSYLRKNPYKGKATKSWVQDDYDILMSIHQGLKNSI